MKTFLVVFILYYGGGGGFEVEAMPSQTYCSTAARIVKERIVKTGENKVGLKPIKLDVYCIKEKVWKR